MARKATIREVAERAGVSVGTVSNFVSDKKPISPSTRERIESAIRDLGWIPNAAVRVVKGGRSPVIGFLIPDSSNPFFTEVANGIEDVAIANGGLVITCNTAGEAQREAHFAKSLSEMRVAGAVFTEMTASDQHVEQLVASGATVVLFGLSEHARVNTVSVDDELGGFLAGQHLVERGCRNIALLGGPGGEPQLRRREAGIARALTPAHRTEFRRLDAQDNSLKARVAAATEVLRRDPAPDGIICGNDQIALAVLAAATAQGIRVPQDLAVVGYDDIEAASLAAVPLTTVRNPSHEMGRLAAKMIIERTVGDRIALEPELVVRRSTSP
ncbi:LacI family DNA-binding transcriptional regulator [Streptomyces scopuliridis]|uniref:LacI family DNA-binding transcriptional regulator n=1 Tax=Streptomyces scopuliridis TaxID=452529 RepID=UPI0036AEEBA1